MDQWQQRQIGCFLIRGKYVWPGYKMVLPQFYLATAQNIKAIYQNKHTPATVLQPGPTYNVYATRWYTCKPGACNLKAFSLICCHFGKLTWFFLNLVPFPNSFLCLIKVLKFPQEKWWQNSWFKNKVEIYIVVILLIISLGEFVSFFETLTDFP